MTATIATERAGLAVRCEEVVHIYRLSGNDVVALRGVDLEVDPGETVALLGPSGSGKSTVLSLLAGLLRPSAGRVLIGTNDIARMSERQLLALRSNDVGIVVQGPGRNLLPYATAADNVRFAQQAVPRRSGRRLLSPAALLDRLGLSGIARQRPASLSGGEQQRLSLAVGLATGPGVLLADEPTSQLDTESRDAVLDLLRTANIELGTTVVLVSHDPVVAHAMGRSVTIRDGRVGSEGRHGEEYAVVGRDGSVQLPTDVLDLLPPGTLARVVRHAHGVELRNPHLEQR